MLKVNGTCMAHMTLEWGNRLQSKFGKRPFILYLVNTLVAFGVCLGNMRGWIKKNSALISGSSFLIG